MNNLPPPPALSRRRDVCPACNGGGVDDGLICCKSCGGYGFTDESDADFRKRMHEHMRTAAGAQEKPRDYFTETLRNGCTDGTD